MAADSGKILALDVGGVRIGLALASSAARLATPYGTINNDESAILELSKLCEREQVTQIVIGLPRGLGGQDTQQTKAVQELGHRVAQEIGLPLEWQDEALTSVLAEAELNQKKKPYQKGDIDALAATLILEDYLRAHV